VGGDDEVEEEEQGGWGHVVWEVVMTLSNGV
jgi:hypothetical protein